MNRIKRWLSIYFPEYTTVFKSVDDTGSLLLLEKVALPEDILKLGASGINQIWRDAKLWLTERLKGLADWEEKLLAQMEKNWTIIPIIVNHHKSSQIIILLG